MKYELCVLDLAMVDGTMVVSIHNITTPPSKLLP